MARHCSWVNAAAVALPHAKLARFSLLAAVPPRSAYTSWDTYLSWNQLIANIIIARSLHKALADWSVLRFTWHMHVTFLINILSTAMNLVLALR
jgi:hypothetical protein